MVTQQMRKEYNEYLEDHIKNVKTAFEWMLINLTDLFKSYDSDYLGNLMISQIDKHDKSKYVPEEYDAYAEYFYGEEKTDDVEYEFNAAWLHHQHNNPHHWQHWVLREDDGNTFAIEMPFEYVCEMIADWWAFSWKKNNLYEIFDWYEKNKGKQVLHDNTRAKVEEILEMIKIKLDEIHTA